MISVKEMKKFAMVAVQIGANLQPGQDAVIFISTKQRRLAALLAEECYRRGARKVTVEWKDEEISRLKYRYQSIKTLKEIDRWEISKARQRSQRLPVLIHIEDDDPDAFASLDPKKIAAEKIARAKATKVYRNREFLYDQWTILAVPSTPWAKKVFPELPTSQAKEALWQAIRKTTRLDSDHPIAAWEEHIADLKKRAQVLNELNLEYLVYTSSNGTNLKLQLQPDHQWLSARSKSLQQIEYCANLPTEEVFTMPKRDGVDGVAVATKPLSYDGKVIEGFKVYFEKGRIVKTEAAVNGDVLQRAIDTDEGSHYLGEVALVPFNSPINQTGLLFFNTLFDENACCHLAFGEAFEDNIKGYETLSREELKEKGFNESLIHVDFMIGSEDLSIVGVDGSGKEHPIFKNGVWAF